MTLQESSMDTLSTSPSQGSFSHRTSSGSTAQRDNVVDISDLNLPQLEAIHHQLQEELQVLTHSYTQLKQAQSKFLQCDETLETLMKSKQDSAVLVPLTNSLYVSGHLVDAKRVMLDMGTGYFVEKGVDQARAYYQRRSQNLQSHLHPLQSTISNKQINLRTVANTIQGKMLELQASAS